MSAILVTGASRGIGLATALAFARAGHTVAATLRNPDAAPEVGRIAASEKLAVSVYTMDVVDDASVQHAVRRVEAELGPVEVLVNNAGIERTGSVEEMPSRTSATLWKPTASAPSAAFRPCCRACARGVAAASLT